MKFEENGDASPAKLSNQLISGTISWFAALSVILSDYTPLDFSNNDMSLDISHLNTICHVNRLFHSVFSEWCFMKSLKQFWLSSPCGENHIRSLCMEPVYGVFLHVHARGSAIGG